MRTPVWSMLASPTPPLLAHLVFTPRSAGDPYSYHHPKALTDTMYITSIVLPYISTSNGNTRQLHSFS